MFTKICSGEKGCLLTIDTIVYDESRKIIVENYNIYNKDAQLVARNLLVWCDLVKSTGHWVEFETARQFAAHRHASSMESFRLFR